MKRNTLLVLTYAILFSMVAVSFSLYHTTVPPKTVAIESKVFDISRTATVNDSQYLENTPSWMFMVFNTGAISDSDYDTNVQVTLSSAVTNTNLQVAIYDTNNEQPLAVSSFTNGIANLIVPRQFANGLPSQISLSLRYSYNNISISDDNIPFSTDSVNASVTVWGSSPNDPVIISSVMLNKWCSANLLSSDTGNSHKTYVSGYVKGITQTPATFSPHSETGTITIKFVKTTSTGTLTIWRSALDATTLGDHPSCEILIIDTSAYVNPNAVVIQNEDYSSLNNFTITNLNLNDDNAVYAGPYLGTSPIQKELFRNFHAGEDGSFVVSFDYSSVGSGTAFSINFGSAQ